MADNPKGVETHKKGTVHEFPAGRLRSFEDEEPEADLGTLLPRRAPLPGPVATSEPAAADPRDTPRTLEYAPAAPVESATEVQTDIPDDPSRSPAEATPDQLMVRGQNDNAPTPPSPSAVATPPVRSRVRASNVHIPVALLPAIARGKKATKLSNGELVIAALEACGDRLADLVGARTPTGGSLFAARATRTGRSDDGPLTAFNIRLREEDYEVLDLLVERYGASSRGHLVTVALTDYLSTTT